MIMENVLLSDASKREASRLLAQVEQADSMFVAAKAGARADGFILGLRTAGCLLDGDAQKLSLFFDAAVDERLKALATGRGR